MSAVASARSGSGGDYHSIGTVLGRLRPDFPDITISKIRFLESEGLVEPERAPSGYRKFSHADIERLRFVLSVQRDHYLPLRVIKDHLDAMDRGEDVPLAGVRRLAQVTAVPTDEDGHPTADAFAPVSDVRMTRQDLLEMADIDDDLLTELESYGLVSARHARDQYDGDAAAIAKAAGELAAHGLEPRHLRSFRAAADREVGLIDQLVAPLEHQRNADAQAHAEETARDIATSLLRLHALLVKSGLRSRS